jgi:hypothetical protein
MVDTKFDGLRTAGAKRALVGFGCFAIGVATLLYWPDWTRYSLDGARLEPCQEGYLKP